MSVLLALLFASTPRVLAPAPDAWTTQPSLRVFVEADGGGPVLVSVVDGGTPACKAYPSRDGGGDALLHCTVALSRGANQVRATAGADTAAVTLIRFDTLGPMIPGVASEGLGTAVHAKEVEARCAACHKMDEAQHLDGGSLLGSECLACHPVDSRRTVHGPVGQGQCVACHDPASEPRYQVRWPMQETCFKCHVDIKALMNDKAFRHGPAAAGRCTTCHDPHGSENLFWLKKKPFDLCTNCHTEKLAERHVVVGFVYGDSHPLRDRPHPLKAKTEFACPSCHNPHAAQARYLWQFDATRRETLCRTCHQK